MKKTISLALITVMVFSNMLVSADVLTIAQEAKVYELTLKQAIDLALENNAQIEANVADQRGKKLSLDSAYIQQKKYKYADVAAGQNFEGYCLKNGYYVKAAKVQHELSKMQEGQIKGSTAYNVAQSYYNYVLVQKMVNAAQNAYELSSRNCELINAQYDMGLVSKMDYNNAQISVAMAKNALESNKRNLEICAQNLKILIGMDEENCIINTFDDADTSEYTSDVQKDIESAMETRYDVVALKKSAYLSDEYLKMAKILTTSSSVYNTAYASSVKANHDYDNGRKLIALNIRSSYNDILDAKAELEVARRAYELKVKEYERAKLEYELGMTTNLQLTESINKLYESQTQYANAKITYTLAVAKYKYEITAGL